MKNRIVNSYIITSYIDVERPGKLVGTKQTQRIVAPAMLCETFGGNFYIIGTLTNVQGGLVVTSLEISKEEAAALLEQVRQQELADAQEAILQTPKAEA